MSYLQSSVFTSCQPVELPGTLPLLAAARASQGSTYLLAVGLTHGRAHVVGVTVSNCVGRIV